MALLGLWSSPSSARSKYTCVSRSFPRQSRDMDFKALVSKSEGWCSVEKMEKMVEEARLALLDSGDLFLGVELGVFAGRSLIPIADLLHSENVEGMIYGIDPWATAEATKGYSEEHEKWWREVDLPEFLKRSHDLVRQ